MEIADTYPDADPFMESRAVRNMIALITRQLRVLKMGGEYRIVGEKEPGTYTKKYKVCRKKEIHEGIRTVGQQFRHSPRHGE